MSEAPQLLVVVDTEEEFDWNQPFSRGSVATASIPAQAAAHRIFDRFDVVPTYVIDYPVATDPAAARFLRRLKEAGKAAIGAHLHPWVTPPHEESVTAANSYHCNLPPALERSKMATLTDAITQAIGEQPTIFKAGRYGFGASTRRTLVELGYRIDCSFVPHASFSEDGGPSYYRTTTRPTWLDPENGLLEVPLTNGFFGRLPGLGSRFPALFDNRAAERLRLPGVLARMNLVARSRLSPEGVPASEQCRLMESLHRQGQRLFTLSYHSPSLVPGNTPYVRSAAELDDFLRRIETVLAHFRDVLGGHFTTLDEVYAREAAALGPELRERRVVGRG